MCNMAFNASAVDRIADIYNVHVIFAILKDIAGTIDQILLFPIYWGDMELAVIYFFLYKLINHNVFQFIACYSK